MTKNGTCRRKNNSQRTIHVTQHTALFPIVLCGKKSPEHSIEAQSLSFGQSYSVPLISMRPTLSVQILLKVKYWDVIRCGTSELCRQRRMEIGPALIRSRVLSGRRHPERSQRRPEVQAGRMCHHWLGIRQPQSTHTPSCICTEPHRRQGAGRCGGDHPRRQRVRPILPQIHMVAVLWHRRVDFSVVSFGSLVLRPASPVVEPLLLMGKNGCC